MKIRVRYVRRPEGVTASYWCTVCDATLRSNVPANRLMSLDDGSVGLLAHGPPGELAAFRAEAEPFHNAHKHKEKTQ